MAASDHNFFTIDPSCAHLVPTSLTNAMRLATHVLRSEFHQTILISLYDDLPGVDPHHINKDSLTALINQNGVVSISEIRQTGYLQARAVVVKDYDPWTILINPLMLVEAQDREREAGELADFVGVDLLRDAKPFADLAKTERNPPRRYNQLAYVQQKERAIPNTSAHLIDLIANRKRKATELGKFFSGKHPKTEIFFMMNCLTVFPSNMSVLEKNTLMLTILLLHNAHHMINRALSSFYTEPKQASPAKIFSLAEGIDSLFYDIGHLMERHLWGFCIGHAGEPHAPTPFGIHEIIGTLWQNRGKKSILVASAPLRALLNNPFVTPMPPVTTELLRLSPTSGGEFTQKASTVVLGGFSAGNVDPESGKGVEELAEDDDAEEEEETENMKLPRRPLFYGRR